MSKIFTVQLKDSYCCTYLFVGIPKLWSSSYHIVKESHTSVEEQSSISMDLLCMVNCRPELRIHCVGFCLFQSKNYMIVPKDEIELALQKIIVNLQKAFLRSFEKKFQLDKKILIFYQLKMAFSGLFQTYTLSSPRFPWNFVFGI